MLNLLGYNKGPGPQNLNVSIYDGVYRWCLGYSVGLRKG